MDTIYALASGSGRAGIAVFRLSGSQAGAAIRRLGRGEVPPARRASFTSLRLPSTGELIDRSLCLWFPGPKSYTGEDVAEFHVHGGRAVIEAMTEALGALPGCRLAEPGEFTRRAFENGKLDLTEAEAVSDLVAAETAAQRRQALRQLDGELGRLYDGWREGLVRTLAHLEAWIDFPDEDLPEELGKRIGAEIASLSAAMSAHLNDGGRGERLRDGLRIAIVGAPNVGKSSLLNALAKREAAIVSETAGTTRDVIEVHLDLGGFPVVILDTAGLRETVDEVEREGVRRAREGAGAADLKIVMFDATSKQCRDPALIELVDENAVVVMNKIDVRPDTDEFEVSGRRALKLSARRGDGIGDLMDRLSREAALRVGAREDPVLTRARHRAALTECHAALSRAASADDLVLRAEDLRLAVRALGRITGRVDVEDILDVIFRDFCIGK